MCRNLEPKINPCSIANSNDFLILKFCKSFILGGQSGKKRAPCCMLRSREHLEPRISGRCLKTLMATYILLPQVRTAGEAKERQSEHEFCIHIGILFVSDALIFIAYIICCALAALLRQAQNACFLLKRKVILHFCKRC
jgi:hypothetical protein